MQNNRKRGFKESGQVASFILAGSVFIGVVGCATPHPNAADSPLPTGAVVDRSIKPGDDFFNYVNAHWLAAHPIPAEKSQYGVDTALENGTQDSLHQLLEEMAHAPEPADPTRRSLRNFYVTAMDEKSIDAAGLAPLKPELDRIAAVNSADDIMSEIGHLRSIGVDAGFSFYIGQDDKQSDRYAVHLSQGGLGLPERDYYLGTDADSKSIRDAYREHVGKMFVLAGDSEANAKLEAVSIVKLETRLAELSRTPTGLRDPDTNYNRKSIEELQSLTPAASWTKFDAALAGDEAPTKYDYVVVGQPEFFRRFNEMLAPASTSLDDWRTYFRWHLLDSAAPFLSKSFETEDFHFSQQVLNGVKEMEPRWKRTIHQIDSHMGQALARPWVEKHFPPSAKARIEMLVHNVIEAQKQRLETRDWMSPETKKIAVAKLAAMNVKVAYPDHWRDYSKLAIGTDSYVQNSFRANAFEVRFWLDKLNGPVDKTLWSMNPTRVDCYYDPNLNEIVFPAGILQLPYFDPNGDDAINYGGIGAAIGHEITHGFDDQGRKYDAKGNLKNWWTEQDRERFEARSKKLVEQFNAAEPLPGTHVNGELTLGENIADLGGVTIAYQAYLNALNGKPAPTLGGWTGAQRFFLAYAFSWCDERRDEDTRLLVRTDPHAPAMFRVLVPLSNFAPFYDAFGITTQDKIYRKPEDRAEIW